MGFFSKLLGSKKGGNDAVSVYRTGDNVPCESCHQMLKVKYFPGGKIITGGPAAVKGIALVCQQCGFITCIDCAMKPMGVMQACPSCQKPLGPTTFTEGVDVPKKQVSPKAQDPSKVQDSKESTAPTTGADGRQKEPPSEFEHAPNSEDLMFSCPNCGQRIACDKSGAGSEAECPTCHEPINIPAGEVENPANTPTSATPTRPSEIAADEDWTPVNPQVSSRMPFAALEQIFIFTTGDGQSVFKSTLVTGMLQDTVCKPLRAILAKIPVDVVARSDVGAQVIRNGSIPDSAWTAMSAIKPPIAQQARNGQYRSCVRPFQAETNEIVALFLLYNKKML